MGVEVRAAGPGDAAFLAWVILTAGRAHGSRGIWEVILGAPEDRCLQFLELLSVTEDPHLFHHSCFLVAEAGGRPAAALGGYDPKVLGYPALRSAIPEAFRKARLRPPEELAGGGSPRILECIPPAVEGAWVIDSVATVPEFRRKGIVSTLLGAILDKGRRLGFRCAQIDIYIGNTAAQRAYEKHGFRILDEKRDPYFEAEIGSPGMARLVRSL